MNARLERIPQQCVYSIHRECDRSCIGGTGRPLAVHLREDRHNLKEDILEKSKSTTNAYENGHRVG
jgi:hypothetical protein